MTLKLLTSTLLAGFALAGAALAQDREGDRERFCADGFLAVDAAGDGRISPQEAAEAADSEFSMIDLDDTGTITLQEYLECTVQWAERAVSASIAMSDREVLERTEMADSEFTHVDRDGDGIITQEEFMTWVEVTHRVVMEEASAGSSDDTAPATVLRQIVLVPVAPDADPAGMSREEMAARAAQQFIFLDTAANLQLDRQEWSGQPESIDHVLTILSKRFETMDADKSGVVTRDEFVAEAMRSYTAAQARAVEAGEDATTDPSVVYYRYPHPMERGPATVCREIHHNAGAGSVIGSFRCTCNK